MQQRDPLQPQPDPRGINVIAVFHHPTMWTSTAATAVVDAAAARHRKFARQAGSSFSSSFVSSFSSNFIYTIYPIASTSYKVRSAVFSHHDRHILHSDTPPLNCTPISVAGRHGSRTFNVCRDAGEISLAFRRHPAWCRCIRKRVVAVGHLVSA